MSKWPINTWVSTKRDCKIAGHVWRLQSDHSTKPNATLNDLICIECDFEIFSKDLVERMMDPNFMPPGDYTNDEFWDKVAEDMS